MGVAARQPHGSLTYRDLWHTPEDGNRYEIIEGEVYVTPPPSVLHQRVSGNLGRLLMNHVIENDLGIVLFAPVGVVLERATGVQTDIIFIATSRLSIVQERAVHGAPDLVVEVMSPSTAARDRGVKKGVYARAGVSHYWLVDPRKHALSALCAQDGRYVVEAELAGNAVFRPSLFPGLAIRLAEVWVTKPTA